MFSRLLSFVFLSLLTVGVAAGGLWQYKVMTTEEEVGSFNFNRERALEVEAGPLVRQTVTPVIETFGTIESGVQTALSFQLAGTIETLAPITLSGGNVREGDLIATVKIDDVADSAETLQIAVDEATVRIEQLSKSGNDLTKEVEALDAQFALETANYEARQRLVERGFLASNALRTDEQALLNARAQLDSSRARLSDVINERRLAELALDRANIALRAGQSDLQSVTLRAPADGFVGRSQLSVGQAITTSAVVAPFTPLDGINVSFRLGFSDYGRLLNSEAIDGDPTKLEGRDTTAVWQLGERSFTYPGKVVSVDRTAIAGAASVRISARLAPVAFTDPIALGAQVTVQLPEEPVENVYLVSERAISNDDQVFSILDGAMQTVSVQRLGYSGEQAIVRGNFGQALAYVPIRTQQMYNGMKARITNPQDMPAAPRPAP